MNKYVLHNTVSVGDNNAGSKAGRDAVKIAEKLGYKFVPLYRTSGVHTTVWNMIEGCIHAWRLSKRLQPGDIVFLQYPINRQLMKRVFGLLKRKKVHIVTLIHDIDYLRNVPYGKQGVQGMKKLELDLLQSTEYLICHNPVMIEILRQENLDVYYISLDLFDYLYDGPLAINTHDNTVIIAGNLAPQKAGFLYKLKNHDFHLALYGPNYMHSDDRGTEYMGSFLPDELIPHLRGAYGLVWDGDDADTCAGAYGKYLQANNPHKVSLYLAAGLPVIVWKQSALYPFVRDNGVGIGIESLDELDDLITKPNKALAENVAEMRGKVCSGYFLTSALKKAEERITDA